MNNKKSKLDTKLILETAIIFDAILNCEKEIGIIIPNEYLFDKIIDDAKRYNKKIGKRNVNRILDVLLLGGIIFYPRKGYVERFAAYKEHQETIKKVFIGGK